MLQVGLNDKYYGTHISPKQYTQAHWIAYSKEFTGCSVNYILIKFFLKQQDYGTKISQKSHNRFADYWGVKGRCSMLGFFHFVNIYLFRIFLCCVTQAGLKFNSSCFSFPNTGMIEKLELLKSWNEVNSRCKGKGRPRACAHWIVLSSGWWRKKKLPEKEAK